MTQKYSPLQSLIQKIPASKLGPLYLSHIMPKLDRFIFKLTNKKATFSSWLAGLPIVMLTSTGAKSGLPRTVPLLCIRNPRNPQQFAIIATNWGKSKYPAWYYNLKANPEASCSIRGQQDQYTANEVDGADYEMYWQTAVNTYIGFPAYKQQIGDRHIPIIVMAPIKQEERNA